jgi:hypothetical protein
MKNFNYIRSFGGWLGLVITLLLVIFFNKCDNAEPQIIREKTEIHNYYDSAAKPIPVKFTVPGAPIFIPVPADVDTAKILAMYFAKYPYARVFSNDSVTISLYDTLSKNSFHHPGKMSYQWHLPIKTVESTTITVEQPKKIAFLIGSHVNFNQKTFADFGPDVYLKTKRDQLIGVGYNIDSKEISFKTAFKLNARTRNKNK